MPGPTQIIVIVAIIIVLFGAKKLPELAKALRQSVDEFKKPDETKSASSTADNQQSAEKIKELESEIEKLKNQKS